MYSKTQTFQIRAFENFLGTRDRYFENKVRVFKAQGTRVLYSAKNLEYQALDRILGFESGTWKVYSNRPAKAHGSHFHEEKCIRSCKKLWGISESLNKPLPGFPYLWPQPWFNRT
jgi:hypothetical protein